MKKTVYSSTILTLIVFYSCTTQQKKQTIAAAPAMEIDSTGGSCPYLTSDLKNHVVLSWIKQVDTATAIFSYALSADEGKTFGQPIDIQGSTNVHPHGENLPKIIFKPSGEIIAVWGAAHPNPKNAYSGLVYYSQSTDEGKTWSRPVSLTNDTASFDQRYFDVALLPNGEVAIVWLDNRKRTNKEGSGLYYAETNGHQGFQQEHLISEPCCPCCRTDLFVDAHKNIHVLYRGIVNDSIRDMVHIQSADNGATFSTPERISKDNWVINGCPHTGPAMAENTTGLHFTWFTGGKDAGIFYNHATPNGKAFSDREHVSGKAAKHCQIATLPNDNILIVWNESFPNGHTFSSRIGIEERDAKGSPISRQYLTDKNSQSSFPVIYPVSAHKAVVAYTENRNGKEKVLYKQLSIN